MLDGHTASHMYASPTSNKYSMICVPLLPAEKYPCNTKHLLELYLAIDAIHVLL